MWAFRPSCWRVSAGRGGVQGAEFHGDGAGAGGAGEAEAPRGGGTGVVCAEFAVLSVDDADAVDEVPDLELNEACWGAAEGKDGEALLIWCDAVEDVFFVVVVDDDLGEAGVVVLQGGFSRGEVDHGKLVTAVALAVGKGCGGRMLASLRASARARWRER